jgi:anhydro-N-acetylmuramic acid kinase
MHYIGLMSGTSVDGIDAVLVAITDDKLFKLIATHGEPIPSSVVQRIQSLMHPGDDGLDSYGTLDMELGALFAKAANAVLSKAGMERKAIRAIGSHGQSVRHRPTGKYPFTLQIGNPSVIAEETGVTTVADFRARDMAAGGQGAPLVPAFHHWLFKSQTINRAVVNIGGIANITHLPANGSVSGFDIGPGNTLLDQWTKRHLQKNFDENGKWAAQGKVNSELLKTFMADAYFGAPAPKSTGPEYFNLEWIDRNLMNIRGSISKEDVQATLVALTAETIASVVNHPDSRAAEVYVCGGGSHNATLMDTLRNNLSIASVQVATTAALGMDPDWVEASAFAWLAHQTLDNLPGNVPTVTGAKHPAVLGGIYRA